MSNCQTVASQPIPRTRAAWQALYAVNGATHADCRQALAAVNWEAPVRTNNSASIHEWRPITPQLLQDAFHSIDVHSAAGLDNWTVRECQAWPLPALQVLADLLTAIEQGQQ